MSEVMADRRTAARYPLILVAEVMQVSTGARISARSSDASMTGCCIDTLVPMPKGTSVRVRLTRNSEVFEAIGKVAYVSAGLGMGIAFDNPIPSTQLAILEGWLMDAARSSS